MKGSTAINLFVQDMPRLCVDIDVVYLPWHVPRDQTPRAISQELGNTKLIVENTSSQVKVKVNVVFRGTVLPPERRPLTAKTADLFEVEFELPILARDEIYAGKLVASLDR